MRKLLVVLDDETFNLLAGEKNKSKFVRESIKYVKQDISTDTVDEMKKSYVVLVHAIKELLKLNKELNSKLDYIARKIQ